MERVPRHEFVPEQYQSQAYADHPLPIGHGQTISQPYIVALMTELLALNNTDRVLEIGTGSGYQAAILAEIVAEVYTIEIVEPLAVEARERLERMGYTNVHTLHADGYLWLGGARPLRRHHRHLPPPTTSPSPWSAAEGRRPSWSSPSARRVATRRCGRSPRRATRSKSATSPACCSCP